MAVTGPACPSQVKDKLGAAFWALSRWIVVVDTPLTAAVTGVDAFSVLFVAGLLADAGQMGAGKADGLCQVDNRGRVVGGLGARIHQPGGLQEL